MQAARGELSGLDISLRVRPTQPKLDLPLARFSWALHADAGAYTLQLNDLHAELARPPLADGTPLTRILALTTLTGHYVTPTAQRGQFISVTGDHVDLGILAEFSRTLPLPAPFPERTGALQSTRAWSPTTRWNSSARSPDPARPPRNRT